MENIVYTTIMLAVVGFALTAQTAFATSITSTSNMTFSGSSISSPSALFPGTMTNEHDFKYGFKRGEADYQWQATDRDPGDNIQIHSGDDIGICQFALHKNYVLNATSCIGGYVRGFQVWCDTHREWCAGLASYPYATIPIQLTNDTFMQNFIPYVLTPYNSNPYHQP